MYSLSHWFLRHEMRIWFSVILDLTISVILALFTIKIFVCVKILFKNWWLQEIQSTFPLHISVLFFISSCKKEWALIHWIFSPNVRKPCFQKLNIRTKVFILKEELTLWLSVFNLHFYVLFIELNAYCNTDYYKIKHSFWKGSRTVFSEKISMDYNIEFIFIVHFLQACHFFLN